MVRIKKGSQILAQKPKRSNANVTQIIEESDIVKVAEALGLQLDKRQTQPRRALCPFHNDRNPSLNLYHKIGGRDNFYCFSCGASGDIVSLVQRRLNLEFWEAIKWLAPFTGATISNYSHPPVDRRSGAILFSEKLRAFSDDAELTRIAGQRGFSREFLHNTGAAVYDLGPLRREAASDRALQEALWRAGIIRPSEASGEQAGGEVRTWLRGFYSGRRLVFPLCDISGVAAGFAARALDVEVPRYLYSFDFPRRDTLYGADHVVRALVSNERRGTTAQVYIVEGLFDQLRLHSLGFDAVALLGSRITIGQVELLKRLVAAADSAGRELTFRVFLDPDEAGRLGAYDLLIALMRLLNGNATFGIDVIVPPSVEAKADPDAFLKGLGQTEAATMLEDAARSPFGFMLAVLTQHTELPLQISNTSPIQLARCARMIANSLPDVSWARVLAPLHIEKEFAGFADMIRSYGDGTAPAAVAGTRPPRESGDPRAVIISALTMGRSSTQRREYPLDDDAWERLAIAASPMFHIHCERLAVGDGPMAPLLARHLPKGGGRKRLKAGPVAADALLQQYALIELLRDRWEAPGFSDRIPAVRYDGNRSEAPIYSTGSDGKAEALSFAYQVDMDVVNGLTPPRREGIFRPYFECWRSFIDYLDTKIRHYRHEDLQVLRLDVTGFYEFVKFDVVGDALQNPLERALSQLALADGGPADFAPLLRPDPEADAAKRAHVFTDFLLRHAFHCDHGDPETGKLAKLAGLPQGPDLSAYLANISLFGLDELMRAEVARIDASYADSDKEAHGKTCSSAYARYVDDIIIICPSADMAGQLRRKIEAHLQVRGLSLNRKNPTPPAGHPH